VSDRAALLRITNVSKTFPGQRALADVDLEIRPGEICALLGQNGCGKSTLIKVLAGYHEPDPGARVQFDGGVEADLVSHSGDWREHLRFIHQDLGLVDTLDALDNLALGPGFADGSSWRRIRWGEQAGAAERLLRELGVAFDLRVPVGRLSPVERTMLAVARAMRGFADRHGVLVLDEPTAALSAPEVDRLFAVLRRLKDRGIAILFVSHRLDEVYALASRAVILREGRVVGSPELSGTPQADLIDMITGGASRTPPQRSTRTCGDVALAIDRLAARRLRDVSFRLHRGEILGVAGLDGSGRDELAGLIFGGEQVDGTVALADGVPVRLGPAQSIHARIAYLPAGRARHGVVPTMSCGENLTVTGLAPFWRRGRVDRRLEIGHTRDWLERVSVRPNDPARPITQFSGGNQQKVMLAKWLRTDPQILLLEEPTQGIDIEAKQTVLGLVADAASDGVAVLLCSSEAEDLVAVCDRVLVLRHGRVSAELSDAQMTVPTIVAATVGENVKEEVPA